MIKLYKDLTILYFASIIALVIIDIFLQRFYYVPTLIVFIFNIIVFCLIVIFFYKTAQKRFLKLVEYFNNCQVNKYIDGLLKLSKSNNNINNTIKISLSSAYFAIGDNKKAIEILQTIQQSFSQNRVSLLNDFGLLNNYCALYILSKDIKNSVSFHNKMKMLLDNPNFKEPYRSQCNKIYLEKKYAINVINDEFAGAYRFFADALETENTLLGKVNFNYYLGLICLHNNDIEAAKKHFAFIAENGGDTAVCKKAKEKLEEI